MVGAGRRHHEQTTEGRHRMEGKLKPSRAQAAQCTPDGPSGRFLRNGVAHNTAQRPKRASALYASDSRGDTRKPPGFDSFADLTSWTMTNQLAQPYQRIANDLRDQILGGRLQPHQRLPSHKELGDQYGVATATVQRALSELRNGGWIYSHQGRGSFVHASPGTPTQGAPQNATIQRLQAQVAELSGRLARLEAGQSAAERAVTPRGAA